MFLNGFVYINSSWHCWSISLFMKCFYMHLHYTCFYHYKIDLESADSMCFLGGKVFNTSVGFSLVFYRGHSQQSSKFGHGKLEICVVFVNMIALSFSPQSHLGQSQTYCDHYFSHILKHVQTLQYSSPTASIKKAHQWKNPSCPLTQWLLTTVSAADISIFIL